MAYKWSLLYVKTITDEKGTDAVQNFSNKMETLVICEVYY
jgi:hypothetical protein